MKLLITTPIAVVVDEPNVVSVRAEDESGSFGILSGHADFLTALVISIVSWRNRDNKERFCAVRRGVLSVSGGRDIVVATRQAVMGDDLDHLEQVVLLEFQRAVDAERATRTDSLRLHTKAIRHILQYLKPDRPHIFGDGL